VRQGPGGVAVIRFRKAGFVLLLIHLSLVGWLMLRPHDAVWVNAANLTPFAGIRADLALGPLEAARRIGGGLLVLAPVGVLLPWVAGRVQVSFWASLARTVTAGAMLSLGIELLQTAVPGRVADVDSLLLNTVGVALAYLAVVPACRAGLRRGPRSRPRPRPRPRPRTWPLTVHRSSPRTLHRSPRTFHRGSRGVAEQEATARDEESQGATPTISRVGIAP
jgi:hypothetical protein